jgi:hypothetical protein
LVNLTVAAADKRDRVNGLRPAWHRNHAAFYLAGIPLHNGAHHFSFAAWKNDLACSGFRLID